MIVSVQSTAIPEGYKACPSGLDITTFSPFIIWRRRIKRNSQAALNECRKHFNNSILTKEQKAILEQHG